MAYAMIEIELSQPLPRVTLSVDDEGIAVLLRRHERPVGFWLEALVGPRELEPAELTQRIKRSTSKHCIEARHEPLPEQGKAAPRQPSVTVAICSRDRPRLVSRCLKHLREQQPGASGALPPFEILVIDNAPSDRATRDAVDAVAGVGYVLEPRPGLNFARNRALREAKGELLAFLDDDVVADRHWLASLLDACSENADAAAFTGQILPLELATDAQIMFEARGGFRRGFSRVRYGRTRAGDGLYPGRAWVCGNGANMAFRREVLRELEGFDEALDAGPDLPGGGDLDMFYRVIRAGHSLVYEPGCLVFHEHRRDLAALRRQYEKSWGRAAMAYIVKSYRSDSGNRPMMLRLGVWWFLHGLWQLQKSLRGRHALPPALLLAELKGGLGGLLGAYDQSLERAERIRRQFRFSP